jgi:murein DD-endopeptidase MepM/ murein hydrolase activator NlpD
MDRIRLHTALRAGHGALLLLLALCLVLLSGPQALAAGPGPDRPAAAQDTPGVIEMKVTGVKGDPTSFRVKWKTTTPTKGWVAYGTRADVLDQVAYDIRGAEVSDTAHWVQVKGAQPGVEYFFVILSDTQRYDNDGSPFRARIPAPDSAPATAATADKAAPNPPPSAAPFPALDAVLDMKVTPISDGAGGFVVKWKTALPGKGWIKYGTDPDHLNRVAYDARGEDIADTTHWVVVRDKQPASVTSAAKYYFVVFIDGKRHRDGNKPFEVLANTAAEPADRPAPAADTSALPTPAGIASSFDFPLPNYAWRIGYGIKNPSLSDWSNCYSQPISNLWHAGEDWGAAAGTAVKAVADGTVVFADPNYSYPGRVIIVRHTLPDGSSIFSMYGHLGSMSVGVNAGVTKGQVIGTILNQTYNGRDNSHLHWEIRTFADGSFICSRSGQPGPGYTYPDLPDTKGYRNPSDYISSHRGGSCLAQSPHPYSDYYNSTWTLTNPDPNAASTRMHFSRLEVEQGYDYVYVLDANNNRISSFSGSYTGGVWSGTVPGRSVKIQFVTDSSVTAWGFCADALQTAGTVTEVIVDERSSGFTKGGAYWWDDWSRGYSGHMYWTYVNGGVINSWGEWRPNLSAGRWYEVYAYVPDYHTDTTSARYEVHHQNGVSTVVRNQSPYYNQWVSLGTFYFAAGTSGYVRLTDATNEAAGSRQIGFDAIKWVPR